jgi:predicted nucleic acid-binding protein
LIYYLDTSVLVAALTDEAATARVQRWLGEREPDELAISQWVATEFSSALSIKLRSGEIGPDDRAAALAAFVRLSLESFADLSISADQFRAAAGFANQHKLGLRAGDALHMAIAADYGATIVTLDKQLAQAALALGVSAQSP